MSWRASCNEAAIPTPEARMTIRFYLPTALLLLVLLTLTHPAFATLWK